MREARLVRSALDACPDGICVATVEGRPILSNAAMSRLSLELTGHTVTDARVTWEEMGMRSLPHADGADAFGESLLLVRLNDGSVWQLRRQTIDVRGETMVQYDASDISDLFAQQERLRDDNLQAELLHERQGELLAGIVRTNLNKELLHTKMRIHDDFGQILLVTKAALASQDIKGEAADLLAGWKAIVQDLRNATVPEDDASSSRDELVEMARMIGCDVAFSGPMPSEHAAQLLLLAAVREALTNAVRHAGANKLYVDIQDQGHRYQVRIGSNGSVEPLAEPLHEGSGLGTLRRQLESEGATMKVSTEHGVVLDLSIPKERDS